MIYFLCQHWVSRRQRREKVAAVSETNIGRTYWRKKWGIVFLSHVLSIHILGWFYNCLRVDIFRPQSRTLLAWVVELGRKEEHWLLFILSWHRNQPFASRSNIKSVRFTMWRRSCLCSVVENILRKPVKCYILKHLHQHSPVQPHILYNSHVLLNANQGLNSVITTWS